MSHGGWEPEAESELQENEEGGGKPMESWQESCKSLFLKHQYVAILSYCLVGVGVKFSL